MNKMKIKAMLNSLNHIQVTGQENMENLLGCIWALNEELAASNAQAPAQPAAQEDNQEADPDA